MYSEVLVWTITPPVTVSRYAGVQSGKEVAPVALCNSQQPRQRPRVIVDDSADCAPPKLLHVPLQARTGLMQSQSAGATSLANVGRPCTPELSFQGGYALLQLSNAVRYGFDSHDGLHEVVVMRGFTVGWSTAVACPASNGATSLRRSGLLVQL